MISLKRARVESLESRRLLSATISGLVYQDIGAVGSLQPGDPPLGGWTVFLDLNHDSKLDPGDPSTVTDASGRYTFTDVAAGTYDVREQTVTGFKAIPDAFNTVTVTDGQTLSNVNLGNQKLVDFTYPGLTAAQDDVNNGQAVTTANEPNSSTAINGKYIVTISGNSINTYRRTDGTLLTTQSLADFFKLADAVAEGPTMLPNFANATDAEVIYNAGVGKFFIAAIANGSDGTSDILIAGSPRLAPNSGNWHYHSIDVQDQNTTTQPKNVSLPTTPNQTASNLSLSFNGNSIYIAANINDSSGAFFGSRLWIVPRMKAFALATTKLVYYLYDPSTSAGLTADLSNIDAANYSSKSISDIGIAYFVANATTADDLVDIIAVRQPGKNAIFSLKTLTTPMDTSSAVAPAAQPDGGPSIDTSASAISAAWRKNFFWIADTLTPTADSTPGPATVYWFELNIPTSFNAKFTPLDNGSVSGSSISTGASTFAPAISIDRDQFVALSFAAAGPSLDLGSYVVSRRTPDPLGTMRPAYTLNAGSFTYSTTGLVEWGSSSMVLDPTTQERFWVLGRAATDPSSTSGPWSQQLIGFELPPKIFPVVNG
jgi:SdrD B-like domain